MTNILGSLEVVDSINDFAASIELYGAYGVAYAEVNGTTFVYVSGFNDDGIQVLSMAGDGTLSVVTSVPYTAANGLDGPADLEVVTVGGVQYLLVANRNSDSITSLEIDADGTATDGYLTHVDTVFDNEVGYSSALDNPVDMHVVETTHGTYVLVPSYNEDAINVFRVNNDGTFALTDTVVDADDADYNLDGARSVTSGSYGGNEYVFVGGSSNDDGISIFSLQSGGTLTSVTDYDSPSNTHYADLRAVTMNGTDYLIASDTDSDNVDVFTVATNGTLTLQSTLNVSASPNYFANVYNMNVMEIEGVEFLILSSNGQDGVVIYGIDDAHVLSRVEYELDSTTMNGAGIVRPITIGNRQFILVTGEVSNTITVVEVGADNDALLGTADNDRIVGMLGDDDLLGLDGHDELHGGLGDDVLSGGLGNDDLFGGAGNDALIGGRGNDFLLGGAGADVLSGGIGRDTISYDTSSAGVTVNLGTGYNSGGDAQGDVLTGIEAVIGSDHADRIIGSTSNDRLQGGLDDDTLLANAGNDTIFGDGGNDSIIAAGGDDTVYGGAGNDNLSGAVGHDSLDGGAGNDTLLGAGGNDVLMGGAGLDRLVAGGGDDTLNGGAARDVFVFSDNTGADVIQDFDVAVDRISLFGVSSLNTFAQVQAAAFTFSGSTVISIGSNSILLENVTEAELTADNFLF